METSLAQDSGAELNLSEDARLARLAFLALDRLMLQTSAYPPGHPAVLLAAERLGDRLASIFARTDRLTVQIHPHSALIPGEGIPVWETAEPRDYCFLLSRDGIYLLHIMAGIDEAEIARFVEILEAAYERRLDPSFDLAAQLFDAGLRYLAFDVVDESMAQLAGVELDLRNRDTRQEQERVDQIFARAFGDLGRDEDGAERDDRFTIRVRDRDARHKKLDVGSREFLALDPRTRAHLSALRRGFTEHAELEHRQAEMLSALLAAQPPEQLARSILAQFERLVGALLDAPRPWEALDLLRRVHAWRDEFDAETIAAIQRAVRQGFTERRVQQLTRLVTQSPFAERRALLSMFQSLDLDAATDALIPALDWNLDAPIADDIRHYVLVRAAARPRLLVAALKQLSPEAAGSLAPTIAKHAARIVPELIALLGAELPPPIKAIALAALKPHWRAEQQVRASVVPLLATNHAALRLEAAHTLRERAPQLLESALRPLMTDALAKRSPEEVRELVGLYALASGDAGAEVLRGLIQRRGPIASEADRALAIRTARALLRSKSSAQIAMLNEVARDWLVPGPIRAVAREVVEILDADRPR